MEDRLSELNKHQIIGWDLDETLINGVNSIAWRKFVHDNPTKHHWIITFRNLEQSKSAWEELSSEFLYPLNQEHFQGLLFLPDKNRIPYDTLPWTLRKADVTKDPTPKDQRSLEIHKLSWEDVRYRQNLSKHWKAQACNSVNATVLVDDLQDVVEEGCLLHGVKFVYSL